MTSTSVPLKRGTPLIPWSPLTHTRGDMLQEHTLALPCALMLVDRLLHGPKARRPDRARQGGAVCATCRRQCLMESQ